MKKLLPILLLATCFNALSQELTPVFEDTIFDKNRIRISSFNYYSSNRFNNDFTDKFIFGGEITPEIKNRVSDKLKRVNSFGGEAEQRIEHYNGDIHPIRNKNYGLMVSFSDNHLVSSNASPDLFRTVMYGNADYLNDTMDFSFSHFQYQHYLKFGVGVFEKKTLSSIQINYVSGSKAIEGRFNDTWMHSKEDSITLMLQGSGFQTDQFDSYWGFQGSGFAIDLNYNFLFETKSGNSQILNLKISNIGMIVWNNNSHQYAVDSMSRYTGFDVQDWINQPEGTSNEYNFDDTLGIQTVQGRNINSLPIEFALQKLPLKNSPQKLQYIMGFKTILTSDYFPYFFGGVYYSPVDNFSASTRLSYGGFGGLQWGINLNYWVKDKVYFGLGTYDMIGNISKKFGFGRSLNFSTHFKL